MSRNFGVGTRNMAQAGERFLSRACARGEMSHASVDALRDRWGRFAAHAKSEGVGRMERITHELVQAYGRGLATQVRAGEMSASYAQGLVSAVNSVMHLATSWSSVSPTKDCHIAQRSHVRNTPVQLDRTALMQTLTGLREAGQERGAAVAELARELGLRSKEASLINARAAFREAQKRGAVTIKDGTKGGRTRSVLTPHDRQIQALRRAALAQGSDRTLIPAHQTWAQWRNGALRETRTAIQQAGYTGLHDLRAAYACERYQIEVGHAAPVNGGRIENKAADLRARAAISEELGHYRIEVVAHYIGGR